ncbi:MAG: hypothetical protein ABFD64_06085 [Armatimonadota bacterium]
MPTFMVESSHTKEECVQSLDELKNKEPEILDKMEFGCMSGVHTGWATVDAANESEVRNMIPSDLRDKARVVEVSKFTPEQIESFHKA